MTIQKDLGNFGTMLCFLAILVLFIGSGMAEADIKQMKIYKEAFPGTKPKCLFCHQDKIPKKGEGKHDLNAYGLVVKEADEVYTKATYEKVGSIEDFEAQMEGGKVTAEEMVEEGMKSKTEKE